MSIATWPARSASTNDHRSAALERINEAFDLMHEGKVIRSVIHY
jgi:Zn-dependent alcohol dehydrogenases, class III